MKNQSYGEFKGATESTLISMLAEIKDMRQDIQELQTSVDELKSWRSYALGLVAGVGVASSFVVNWIFKQTK